MSSTDALNFRCALVTGGGGGIGKAIAEYLIKKGKKVIIAGRTESNLASTSKKIGCAGYYVVDTGAIDKLPEFIRKVTSDHPDLDCLINNAGVQRPLEVLKSSPEDLLAKADNEIDINIRGPLHLTLGLLPHFRDTAKCPLGASVVNVSSALGFVPFVLINPNYNATKAWLHSWSMSLRTQLKDVQPPIRVVEIAPPMVGTDLHRDRDDPDDNKKDNNPQSLTVKEFMEEITKKWEAGDTTISAGGGARVVQKWIDTFGEMYAKGVH